MGNVIRDLRDLYPKGQVEATCVKVFCPFHGDSKTPNLAVYADHVHCYACGVHLMARDFLKKIGKKDFELDIQTAPQEAMGKAPTPLSLPLSVVQSWYGNLRDNPEKLKYLMDRGLSEAIIFTHALGYTGTAYSIPYIHLDESTGDEVVTGCKFRRDDAVSTVQPKYWNLPGTVAQWYPRSPSSVFENQDNHPIWIVEGEFDALVLRSYGRYAYTFGGCTNQPRNLVAHLMGSGLTVYLAFDNDEPGIKAGGKLATSLRKMGLEVFSVGWPMTEGKDITERLQILGEERFKDWLSLFAL